VLDDVCWLLFAVAVAVAVVVVVGIGEESVWIERKAEGTI
jgi:hypothetical protein